MLSNLRILCSILVLLPFCAGVDFDAHAETRTAASASYSAISAAISAAEPGDTVVIPPGTAIWDDQIVIPHGLILQGAGAEQTLITSNYSARNPGVTNDIGNYLIVYKPESPADNEPFRITGFTLDLSNKCGGIYINNGITKIDKIRIDHNTIKNATNLSGTMRGVLIYGTTYGVIDNNLFLGNRKCIDTFGAGRDSWQLLEFTYGTSENMYYEDNIMPDLHNSPHEGGVGGRYCARFNTYSSPETRSPWFDAHGNQDGGNYSQMGVEIYGNTITMTNNNTCKIVDHRGGQGIVFDNNVITTATVVSYIREEYDDSLYPAPNTFLQHVTNSYYWNNTKNGSLVINARVSQDCCNSLAENSEFYNYNTAFDGTTGVGVGSLASRPTSCTPGVAYWATDAGNDWNTANDSPNDGALYKCTEENTWSHFYTPYTYPHPLREEDLVGETSTAPGVPEDLRVID